MNITIIGTGVYGLAIAKLLMTSNDTLTMWTERENPSDIDAPKGTIVTNSYEEAVTDADVVFLLTGAKFIPTVTRKIAPYLKNDTIVVLGSKGILSDTKTPLEIARATFPNPCTVLSGPTFASDIDKLDPVGFTLAAPDKETFDKVSSIMPAAHLEYSSDLLGIELAGSLKNAYAIGSGIISGLNFGFSTTCLYLSIVMREMENILSVLGCDPKSANTLAGLGDMILTCTSRESRNFTYGSLLSSNKKAANDYLEKTTVEGYENIKSFAKLFQDKRVDAPILDCIYDITSEVSSSDALIELLK